MSDSEALNPRKLSVAEAWTLIGVNLPEVDPETAEKARQKAREQAEQQTYGSLRYHPEVIVPQLRRFLNMLSQVKNGQRVNSLLQVDSGSYSQVMIDGRVPTDEAVKEIIFALVHQLTDEDIIATFTFAKENVPEAHLTELWAVLLSLRYDESLSEAHFRRNPASLQNDVR